MSISPRVLDTIRRRALLRRGDRVVVALSGGPDSVALLRLLCELASAGHLEVAGAAHLNHGLRDEAVGDEQFARDLTRDLGVEFRSARVDVRARAGALKTSIEDAGRGARYDLFERVASELGAQVIATGHTRDDQAETFLLRLIRGAGPRGLAGIHPKASLPAEAPGARRWVIRPLIDIRRQELRDYLASIGQPFRDDESNRDVTIPRNRIRHRLLPFLADEFSPRITDVLAREAEIARYDDDRLQQEAIDLLDSIVLDGSVRLQSDEPAEHISHIELDARALRDLHPALGMRVGRLALGMLAPERFVGFEHVERLLELAGMEPTAASVSLPGQQAERRADRVILSREQMAPFSNSFQVQLSIPGEVVLEREGWAISGARDGVFSLECPPLAAQVSADAVRPPLSVRSRRPGDWVRPLGMGGRAKKVQDVLVDRKVPRQGRDSLPLVVDSADRIVWIVGQTVSEDFRVTEPSQGVIFLKARRLGGQG